MSIGLWLAFLTTLTHLCQGRVYFSSGVVRVSVGETTCDVTKYGARGDGKTDDTSAVQKAIDACGSKGGTVLFPNGKTFLLFALEVTKNNVALAILPGATLLLNNDRSKWPSGKDFISSGSKHINNFAILGGGTIKGQGLVWWQHRDDFRPRTVYVKGDKVLIYNITIFNPPNHCLEMYTSNTEISKVAIHAPASTGIDPSKESHNTDAVDIHGSPFYVHGCYFTTGDDNIAAHANDTLVENCYFGRGHGASIGSIGSGVYLKNITFRGITFDGTTTGARIKVDSDAKNGRMSDILYEDLQMTNVGTAIDVSMYYPSNKENSKNKYQIDGVTFRNINAKNTQKSPGEFKCQSSSPCRNIVLDNVINQGANNKWSCKDAHGSANNVAPKSCLSG